MSPLYIKIMLHYHYSPVDYMTNGSKGENCQVEDLFLRGMLQRDMQEGTSREYCISDKGQAYVDALMSVQEPVCKWEVSMAKEE